MKKKRRPSKASHLHVVSWDIIQISILLKNLRNNRSFSHHSMMKKKNRHERISKRKTQVDWKNNCRHVIVLHTDSYSLHKHLDGKGHEAKITTYLCKILVFFSSPFNYFCWIRQQMRYALLRFRPLFFLSLAPSSSLLPFFSSFVFVHFWHINVVHLPRHVQ